MVLMVSSWIHLNYFRFAYVSVVAKDALTFACPQLLPILASKNSAVHYAPWSLEEETQLKSLTLFHKFRSWLEKEKHPVKGC